MNRKEIVWKSDLENSQNVIGLKKIVSCQNSSENACILQNVFQIEFLIAANLLNMGVS